MSEYAFQPILPFRPHWLLPGGHLQTVVGCYLPQAKPKHASTLHRVQLDDGDMLALHEQKPATWQAGDPVALLVHGLGGGGNSCYMVRKADRMCEAGIRSFRLDLRGCGAGITLAKNACHAGRSDDVLAATQYLFSICPGSPVSVIGFSMGANIVLKMAGELGDCVPEHLQHVIAVAPPVKLAACCENMRSGLKRLYNRSFVGSLNQLVDQRLKEAPEANHIVLPRPPTCLYDFDQQITAPLSGFASADEYYELASAAPLLPNIRVPSLMIAAADDPVIPVKIFDNLPMSSHVDLHITGSGGHLGYVGSRNGDLDWRWLDWRLIEQVLGAVPQPSDQAAEHETGEAKTSDLV